MLVAGTTAFDTLARVQRFPGADEAVRARPIASGPGGCGANVARALARFGHEPRLLSAVGGDFAGSQAEADLRAEGVDLSHIVRAEDERTAAAVMATDDELQQAIMYDEGATPRMRELDPLEARWGHFAPGELTAYPQLMAAVDRVVFDPGQEVFYRPLEDILPALDHVDILVVNEHEAERFVEGVGSRASLIERLDALIVTHRWGQRLHIDGEQIEVDAVEADAVDPTGAGDAHCAGLLHGLTEGWKLPEACRFGSAVAACVVEHVGAQQGLPTLAEARRRLEDAKDAMG